MNILLSVGGDMLPVFIMVFIVAVIVGLFILKFVIRWILDIPKIIDLLESQKEYELVQVRLLKKVLIEKGVSSEEIDSIIDKGNKKK
jgi:hypothetical protein